MRHHMIAVTSCSLELLDRAHAEATRIAGEHASRTLDDAPVVTAITPKAVNHYRSFFVAPDGSKEGWSTSDVGDAVREEFLGWMESQRNEDGSSALDWVEVQFGDEEGVSEVTRHSDEHRRAAPATPTPA